MIAVIDNYDSFTYNLVQFLGELILERRISGTNENQEIRVWRNDEIDVEDLAELQPSHVVISPGPELRSAIAAVPMISSAFWGSTPRSWVSVWGSSVSVMSLAAKLCVRPG